MLIKKINENQMEVILDLKDLAENNISMHSFMCASKKCKSLFSNILNYTNNKINFGGANFNYFTETFFIPAQNFFIIIITRTPKKLLLHLCTNSFSLFKFKQYFWLEFNCLDNFCMFCNFLNFKFNASLYLLNEHYFLHIEPKNLKQYFKLLNIAREFSNKIHNNNFILSKNAKCIIKEKAVQTAKKYFV